MKIIILLPGKIKPKVLSAAQEEYSKRLKGFGVAILEYKDEKISSRTSEQTKQAEADRIFKLVKDGDYLVACDERGKKIETLQLAELIKVSRRGEFPFAGKRRMVVVVGGALGLSESVRKRRMQSGRFPRW
jgi:23S rRNA pseudoU1915 N3-methylase RlmH